MTCADLCAAGGWSFMGLQSADHCFCDNRFGEYGEAVHFSVVSGPCTLSEGGACVGRQNYGVNEHCTFSVSRCVRHLVDGAQTAERQPQIEDGAFLEATVLDVVGSRYHGCHARRAS